MRKGKSAWILLVLVLLGALIGGFVGELLSPYKFFKWMSLGGQNGYKELFSFSLSPLIDTHVLRLGISMTLRINAGSIIGMLLAALLYMRK